MTKFIVLDTETTGLGDYAEIVEIAILDDQGNALLNTLIKPSHTIPDEVIAIHGITNEMVADAPTWPDIQQRVADILTAAIVYAYNASFDVGMLQQTNDISGNPVNIRTWRYTQCVMAEFVEKNKIGYPHYSLANAARDYGITFDGLTPHRAASDCAVTLDVLRALHNLPPIATGEHARQYQTVL